MLRRPGSRRRIVPDAQLPSFEDVANLRAAELRRRDEASSGVGDGAITSDPVDESTLRDFPMTLEPMIHMPSPGAMDSAAMVRAHVYNTICQSTPDFFGAHNLVPPKLSMCWS